ncbi:MAG: plasmid maintenance system antidote protein family [Alphaproteobacteria bacterium]|jgi:addiction module HigA family antidote|nr:plasmid maintenance system antidote protein family [Alphaproteobacteria bacterium]
MSWNIHPGEILLEEFMKPLALNSNQLAHLLDVPAPRINDIILQKRGISADTALRLAHYFRTTVKFWMNLQDSYEIRKISRDKRKSIESLAVSAFPCVGSATVTEW